MIYEKWLNEWLELYVKVSTKERTYKKYRLQAEKYVVPALGGYDLDGLGAVVLQRFAASLACRNLAANTVNGVLTLVKSSLKKALASGVADKQFSDAIARPRPRENKVTCFCKADQRKIEKYVLQNNTPHLFGILLSLYTGLRIGELLALTWDDVDFNTMITLQRYAQSLTEHKTEMMNDEQGREAVGLN